ncbi:MAG: 4Fe-4S dicluster domain-containing protein [Dehalococcoidales bacterium]|nr:MAG: 4Fe-4S dicluster domain-containing protein [Dehalococcoidales bacterium]
MGLNRREFLRLSVPAAGLIALSGVMTSKQGLAKAAEILSTEGIGKAVLYDTSKCVGCHACEVACRRWNEIPPPASKPHDLSARTLTLVKSRRINFNGEDKWVHSKWQCMHCNNPTCVVVCPANALYKTELGPVLYDESKCIGCRNCVSACPFSTPRFDWDGERKITKCTFCTDRISKGLEPACVEICSQRALTFGDRGSIISKLDQAEAEGAFIYGKYEAGGTSWMYVSDVPFEERGFPAVAKENYSSKSNSMWKIQITTAAVGVAAIGLYSTFFKRGKKEEESQ